MRARVAVAASRETCHSCSRKLVITTFGEMREMRDVDCVGATLK